MSVIRAIQTISILFLVAAGWIFTRGVAVLDEARTEPMAEPTAIERFLRDRGDKKDGRDYLPPLVQQAQAFALYLNPPRPPAPTPAPKPSALTSSAMKAAGDPKPPAPVQPSAASPKFELHGISYYRAQPERSMALVREPGGSRRWVRPGQQLGHLTIERIESTTLICRDATQTHVIALMADEGRTS